MHEKMLQSSSLTLDSTVSVAKGTVVPVPAYAHITLDIFFFISIIFSASCVWVVFLVSPLWQLAILCSDCGGCRDWWQLPSVMYIDLICESKNHGDPIFLLSYCTSTNGLHFLVHFKYISPLLRKLPWVLEGLRCKTSQVATFQSPNQVFLFSSVQFSSSVVSDSL